LGFEEVGDGDAVTDRCEKGGVLGDDDVAAAAMMHPPLRAQPETR